MWLPRARDTARTGNARLRRRFQPGCFYIVLRVKSTQKEHLLTRKQLRPRLASDLSALATFRLEMRRYLAFAEKAAKAENITTQQFQALLALRAEDSAEVTISALSHSLMLRHHSAVELLDRMEKARLVRRRIDPQDQRRVLIALTAHGGRVLSRVAQAHLANLRTDGKKIASALARTIK